MRERYNAAMFMIVYTLVWPATVVMGLFVLACNTKSGHLLLALGFSRAARAMCAWGKLESRAEAEILYHALRSEEADVTSEREERLRKAFAPSETDEG